jgi:hypothetical protein
VNTQRGIGELSLEQLTEDAERGILDDRADRFLPLDAYGPPTAEELRSVRRAERHRTAGGAKKAAGAQDGATPRGEPRSRSAV